LPEIDFLAAAQLPENSTNDIGGISLPFLFWNATKALTAIKFEVTDNDLAEGQLFHQAEVPAWRGLGQRTGRGRF
jgi:hypothetical protein